MCVEYDELPWSHCYTWREPPHQEHICRGCLDEIAHCYKQREPPHQEHICRGCLDEIGDQLNLSAEIKALRTQAQAHEDKLDSLRAQMEEMKTMLKSLQGYIQRMGGGHEQTSPDRVQNGVRRVLCTEHF